MKYLFTCLCLAASVGLACAQQSKLLIEVGGAYRNTSSESKPVDNYETSQSTKMPKLNVQVGGFLSARGVLGLSYNLSKENHHAYSEQTSNMYISKNSHSIKTGTNSYGIFYRHYLMPFNAKAWNMFLEVNPSYQTTKYKEHRANESWMVSNGNLDNMSQSYSSAESSNKAIDVDLRAGGSYRIAKNFHVQLSLRSIANLNREIENTYLANDTKQTDFQIFQSPLSNAYLSLLFTL